MFIYQIHNCIFNIYKGKSKIKLTNATSISRMYVQTFDNVF